jgi:4'-phosphopantetheinyl transferase
LTLAPNEIHVWLAFDRELADPRLLADCEAMLEPIELERARRRPTPELYRQSLLTRAVLRSLLSAYAPDVAAARWRFVAGEQGKPSLAPQFGAHQLYFNLTHTEGLIAVAFARTPMLGVDAENQHTRSPTVALASRYFTARESSELAALSAAEQPRRFYALWTLKEAWLKATGEGLAAGLDAASFVLDAGHRFAGVDLANDDPAHWRFWQLAPSSEHVLALGLRVVPAHSDFQLTARVFPAELLGSGEEQRPET